MQVVEEFGRTVDEAKEKALKALGGVAESDVEIVILDPGRKATSSGFGAKFARIKVIHAGGGAPDTARDGEDDPDGTPPPPRDRVREREPERDREPVRDREPAREPRRDREPVREREPVRYREPLREPVREADPDVDEGAESESSGEAPADRGPQRDRGRGRRGRGRDRERAPREPVVDPNQAPEDDDEAAPVFRNVGRTGTEGDLAESVLKEVLRLMDIEAEIDRDYDRENSVRFNVIGEDLGALIGKYGQTIESVQYLVNLIASRQNEDYEKVSIDIEGYRDRRERSLEELATRMARKVRQDGKSITLEPMLPSERRIIHMTLSEDPGIRTYSQGEEPMRKVIISPARRGGGGGSR